MLSKLIRGSIVRGFATSITPGTRISTINQINPVIDGQRSIVPQEKTDLDIITVEENKHLSYVLNEVKEDFNDKININFEVEVDGRTLILETFTNGNYCKLAEVITLAGGASLINEFLGYPSYHALVASLGLVGVGALLSYSNFLKRSSPMITQIYRTNGGQLQVNYLKPNGLFGRSAQELVINKKDLKQTSFSNAAFNWLRKFNSTNWVTIDGQLYWYNSDPSVLRTNNHHFNSLI